MNKFYITTAIPYVNAKPHVGHALEFVQADVIARHHKLKGEDVLLLSGGDENAIKNVQAAENEGTPIQEFVDRNSLLFLNLANSLNVKFDVFQKGSAIKHHLSSQKLWEKCYKNGDIYQKEYSGLYCLGCEQFYEKEELNENGECFEHPGKTLETVSEKNYFFRLSSYEKKLKEIIEKDIVRITPQERKNEVLAFLKQGLKDISISRSNKRAKNWGVQVPGDPKQKIYVWFDALNIYQSGVGFGWNQEKYDKWWPADIHTIGKGITRFHAIYWPAFLLSAGLKLPKSIFIHGYFTVNGQKMSKTIGNVIDPVEIINKYGADALRYYLLKEIPPTSDGDFSENRLIEIYNSDLANGLGNLAARIAKMCENNNVTVSQTALNAPIPTPAKSYELIENFRFNLALEEIWKDIKSLDIKINMDKPWKLTRETALPALEIYIKQIRNIGQALKPLLPDTSETILRIFSGRIKFAKPLFPRI